ncbi:MAG: hypothetical protein IH830_02285 [Planctomycetes bacterium]|nr:hypothetical protein [Planctomycetota bacterium]
MPDSIKPATESTSDRVQGETVITFADTAYQVIYTIQGYVVGEYKYRRSFLAKRAKPKEPVSAKGGTFASHIEPHWTPLEAEEIPSPKLISERDASDEAPYGFWSRRSEPVPRTPEQILSDLSVPLTAYQLADRMTLLRDYLASDKIVEMIIQQLHNEAIPPRHRWALLEIVAKSKPEEAVQLAKEQLARRQTDELVLGCTAILRFVPLCAEDSAAICDLIVTQASRLFKARSALAGNDRRLLRELLLVLGAIGSRDHVGMLLDFLDTDIEYVYGEQILIALRGLLVRHPESIKDADLARLIDLGRQRLLAWADPYVVGSDDMFARASRLIEALCARLGEEELELVIEAVEESQYGPLARRVLQHLSACQQELEARGFNAITISRKIIMEKVRGALRALS